MYDILYTSLGGICIYFSSVNLLSVKLSSWQKLALFAFTLLSLLISVSFFDQFSVLITIGGILALIYFYSSNPWLDLSCALFGYLLTVSCNQVFIWGIQLLLHQSLELLLGNPTVSLVLSAIYCVLCYTLTRLLGYLLHRYLKLEILLTDYRLSKTIFLSLLLLTLLFIFNISIGQYIGYNYGVIAFNGSIFLTLFLVFSILIWFLYQSIQQKEQAKSMLKQYEHLQAYTDELEKLYGSQRRFKHDYINILSTLSGYIEQGDLPELNRYFHQEILPISQTFTKADSQLGRLSQIKILELKSILSSKLIYALEKGIAVEVEITKPIEAIPMPMVDFCRVVGIFLDNAIEASLSTDEPFLHLCFLKDEAHTVMILQNSANPPTYPISTLADWGISEKGEHRGIGLYSARTILDSYSNVLWDMKYQSPYFIQMITMLGGKEVSL